MTLTIELSPEKEQALQAAAASQGVALPQLVDTLLEEALRDFEQDKADGEEAMQILANSDPKERRTLDELRQAIRGRKTNGTPNKGTPNNGL